MPYVVRDVESASAAVLALFGAMAGDRITDFTEGAVARSLLEAVVQETQRLDVGAAQGIREGILVGTYRNFGFTPLPATFSSGMVRVTRETVNDTVEISAGQRFHVPNAPDRIYESTLAVTVQVGVASADVPVRCLSVGRGGNTAANTIVVVEGEHAIAFAATNPRPFLTGLDIESEADRAARWVLHVLSFSQGTAWAIEDRARSVVLFDAQGNALERVVNAVVHEPFLEDPTGFIGHVNVYIDNGSGTSSPALLSLVGRTLRGYRDETGIVRGAVSAGIGLTVIGVEAMTVPVVARIVVMAGYSTSAVAAQVQSAIESYLSSIPAFGDVVVAEIVAASMSVPGVVDVTVLDPAENLAIGLGYRASPGVVTVTA